MRWRMAKIPAKEGSERSFVKQNGCAKHKVEERSLEVEE